MNIIWLDDPGCQEVARVGGKVANLSRLASTYQVPTGFCLTTAAFQEWARHEDGRDDEFPPQLLGQLADAYGELAR
jgi:phosphoenolpyruvate synthase/pyruvate phosphate dikinase